ncbi:MAG: glucose-1-phosphate cytidylyltransferase [Gammaproteobacteria bacterium]|jgi:glucose-1-phosphate cytidylyltransferase|nr:glucose-1-phosphate cytidylyltransferase [Gammaproteobacteria bacterium]
MKTVILAGGFGTRLTEETANKPKPMVEVGGRPILWHIMKSYAQYGYKEFVIAMGYKADIIKKYFVEYADLSGNLTVEISHGTSRITQREQDEWVIHLEDTGIHSNTGGRIKQLSKWLQDDTFMVTYGDGVSNVPIKELVNFHKSHGKLATLTAVRPPARFGGLVINEQKVVTKFTEKPQAGEGWINGGFLVFEPQVLELIKDNTSSLEADVLEYLAKENQLAAYCHDGFWQCMDTLRDLKYLEGLWSAGQAPWKVWS